MRFAHDPGTINSAGIEIDRLGVPYDRRLGEPIDASETEITEVFGPSAGAALYRRQMLDEVGGFDVSFYAYLEDADLAWRARMAGWRAVYAPRAVVYHEHSATLRHGSAVKYFLVGRNRVRMLAKNATRAQLLRNLGGMFAYDLGYVVYVLLTARTAAAGRGRIAGLREWRRYRRAGLAGRREVALAPVAGIRAALRRNRAWQR
jgi:GT2 family glycosyltransferase